ncbi:MAG: SDR family oxidoreductase [Chloroflexota bacterium]|nr:SDR family oxidoreductase [Chloroflexota bacterium]
MADATPLAGKRALVTGASKGLGRAIALALAEAGADVAVNARSEEQLAPVRDAILTLGRRSLALPTDVVDANSVRLRLAEPLIAAWGGLDILVNNAGGAIAAEFATHSDAEWERIIALNLHSVYNVTKAFAAGLITQRSGRVINIASIAGKVGEKNITAYTAAKHGVVGLTKALAAEWNPYGITVNAICPGYVDTPMTETTIANIQARTGMSAEQARAALEKKNPQRRLITSEEVASLAVFLALDASRGITGQAINVDGGAVPY